jgi:DNA invertase Pin-like site-specific DNA recombinase
VRNRISAERWEQIKTAYASGIGLREIARNMSIPEGTVLARANREQWQSTARNRRLDRRKQPSYLTNTWQIDCHFMHFVA